MPKEPKILLSAYLKRYKQIKKDKFEDYKKLSEKLRAKDPKRLSDKERGILEDFDRTVEELTELPQEKKYVLKTSSPLYAGELESIQSEGSEESEGELFKSVEEEAQPSDLPSPIDPILDPLI